MTEQAGNVLPHTPVVPLDPNSLYYTMRFGVANPLEFTGWKDEVLSWKQTAYLHGGLNPTQTYRLWGPDAERLLSENCVNSFAKFPVGSAKHAIMCNDDGLILAHGVLVRLGEQEFITYWLAPIVRYLAESGEYDVQGEDLTGKVFLHQIGGPRSLEILEAATGEDLHDIRFLRQRSARIAGHEVSVLRLGMAGSLAYELHGPAEFALDVYQAVREAGEEFGLRRLGASQYYGMAHTENGFPEVYIHFLYPWFEDEKLAKFLMTLGSGSSGGVPALGGSAGDDIRLHYRNPFELGWGHTVKFDHEFRGRVALEREAADPTRKMVTLVWNPEDVLDVYRSHLEPGEEYQYMDFTRGEVFGTVFLDLVLSNGKTVGLSSGRIYSYYYRKMISLCSIDISEGDLGNEVTILWGDPGSRQKEIRATVERFPFYDEDRNETVDVNTIPRPAAVE